MLALQGDQQGVVLAPGEALTGHEVPLESVLLPGLALRAPPGLPRGAMEAPEPDMQAPFGLAEDLPAGIERRLVWPARQAQLECPDLAAHASSSSAAFRRPSIIFALLRDRAP